MNSEINPSIRTSSKRMNIIIKRKLKGLASDRSESMIEHTGPLEPIHLNYASHHMPKTCKLYSKTQAYTLVKILHRKNPKNAKKVSST
eukprot:Gb_07966 [translate_table: standard]